MEGNPNENADNHHEEELDAEAQDSMEPALNTLPETEESMRAARDAEARAEEIRLSLQNQATHNDQEEAIEENAAINEARTNPQPPHTHEPGKIKKVLGNTWGVIRMFFSWIYASFSEGAKGSGGGHGHAATTTKTKGHGGHDH